MYKYYILYIHSIIPPCLFVKNAEAQQDSCSPFLPGGCDHPIQAFAQQDRRIHHPSHEAWPGDGRSSSLGVKNPHMAVWMGKIWENAMHLFWHQFFLGRRFPDKATWGDHINMLVLLACWLPLDATPIFVNAYPFTNGCLPHILYLGVLQPHGLVFAHSSPSYSNFLVEHIACSIVTFFSN